jgi:uncharacterized protein (DUF433 family)
MPGKHDVVERREEVLAGTPVFKGTRVPIKTLFDYLEAGDGIEDFLKDFPTVERKKVIRLLELSKEALVGESSENPTR